MAAKKLSWAKWVLVGIATCLVGAYFIGRLTGAVQFYNVPTPSNEPAIKMGSKIWASSLKEPALKKFITYKQYDLEMEAEAVYVHRCMGMPGNVLQMKDGVLFVNGLNADSGLDLKKGYLLYAKNYNYYFDLIDYYERHEDPFIQFGNYMVHLTPSEAETISTACINTFDSLGRWRGQIIFEMEEGDNFLYEAGKGKWDIDNFGPIKIPADCYFVLGDNRHNARDSRFTGFVPKEKLVGVVLGK